MILFNITISRYLCFDHSSMKSNSAKDPVKTVIRHHVNTDFKCC